MSYGTTDHKPRFSNEKLLRYPHMFPLDIIIWERFIDKYGNLFDGFDYDIKVGKGTEPTEGLDEKYHSMQRALSRFRIDCVGYTSDSIYIFEVKPNARSGALGQILAYTTLYKRDHKETRKIIPAIVTDWAHPDMEYLAKSRGIKYYIV